MKLNFSAFVLAAIFAISGSNSYAEEVCKDMRNYPKHVNLQLTLDNRTPYKLVAEVVEDEGKMVMREVYARAKSCISHFREYSSRDGDIYKVLKRVAIKAYDHNSNYKGFCAVVLDVTVKALYHERIFFNWFFQPEPPDYKIYNDEFSSVNCYVSYSCRNNNCFNWEQYADNHKATISIIPSTFKK